MALSTAVTLAERNFWIGNSFVLELFHEEVLILLVGIVSQTNQAPFISSFAFHPPCLAKLDLVGLFLLYMFFVKKLQKEDSRTLAEKNLLDLFFIHTIFLIIVLIIYMT